MAAFVFLLSAAVLLTVGWSIGSLWSVTGRGGEFVGVILALAISAFLAKAAKFANDAPASGWARQSVGWFYRALLFLPLAGGALWLAASGYAALTGGAPIAFGWLGILLMVATIAAVLLLMPHVKVLVGRAVKWALDLRRMANIGSGGSAAFGGIADEWAARHRPGSILLGASLYDRSWWVGQNDDRGVLTIASSRSGKGRSAIIPNLLVWPGSALVIDPKGTNAAVTARRRADLGQAVHVVDPFGITPFKDDERAGFNPLASIDLASNHVTEDIRQIADALVVSEGDEGAHWNESAQTIIAGVIAHLLASGKGATLSDLRRALSQGNEDLDSLFGDMLADKSAGGLPAAAAALVTNAGPNERGSFFTTVMRNLAWLDSVAMQGTLDKADFALADMKRSKMTVYIVLPPDKLGEHKRFMRLFVNGAINGMAQGGAGRHKVLFLLDEFFSLGRMTMIEQAAGLLSGYGMKLWPIVQNLTQLKELYPQNWETFFANAGTVQVFSVNDHETAAYLAGRLGSRVTQTRSGKQFLRTVSALREVEEMGRDLAREHLRQIIYRSGGVPLVLRRLLYDKDFPASHFAPDPDYAGSPKRPFSDRLRGVGDWLKGAFASWSLPEAAPLPASCVPTMGGEERKAALDARFKLANPPNKFELPPFMRGPVPAPEPAKTPTAKRGLPPGNSTLSFDALLAAPVDATKHAIFERYQLLQEKAGGDPALLSRASAWLTGDYRNNLTGADPFARQEAGEDTPPQRREKGNPWAGRKLSDDELRRKRGDEDE